MKNKLVSAVSGLAVVLALAMPVMAIAASLYVTSTNLPNATVGVYYSAAVGLNYSGSYALNVHFSNLPPGISLNGNGSTQTTGLLVMGGAANLTLSGVPTAPGTYAVYVEMDDQAGGSHGSGFVYLTVNATQSTPPQNCQISYFGITDPQSGSYRTLTWGTTGCAAVKLVGSNATDNIFTVPLSTATTGTLQVGPFTDPGTYYYKLAASATSTVDVVSPPQASYASFIIGTLGGGLMASPSPIPQPMPPFKDAVFYGYPPRNVVNNGTVYLVNGVSRTPYTSAGAFLSYSFNKWTDVVPITSADLQLPVTNFTPNGSSSPTVLYVQPRNGSLINDKGTVYIITNGLRQGFSSATVFTDLGFSFANVITGDTSFMTTITPINNKEQSHPAGSVVNDKGTLYYMQSNGSRVGIPSMEVFYSWGLKLNEVVIANSYDRVTPQGPALQSRMTNQFGL